MSSYQPPFTITNTILKFVAEISESLGRLSREFESDQNLHLRKINRIRTIQGSLAIEGNTLSESQITAILDGKQVIAPPREIKEAHNAIVTYDKLKDWEPSNQDDLLTAHQMLMMGLVEQAGLYRSTGVGVMSGEQVVHMAPQASRVSQLMENLLAWLESTDSHPLIASCIFHYEFEFIHPFADGNGRMGRLWQTLILYRWHSAFANIPVESMIFQHQEEYYEAIRNSTAQTDSAPFIEFMLRMILSTLNDGVNDGVNLDQQDVDLLDILKRNPHITQNALAEKTGKSKRTIERRIKRLKDVGRLERIGSDKTGHWNVL